MAVTVAVSEFDCLRVYFLPDKLPMVNQHSQASNLLVTIPSGLLSLDFVDRASSIIREIACGAD
jgi:hypothetical protein